MSSTRLGYLAIKKETTTATAVKPSHFIRFKEGDILNKQEIIANNPIQNNRWSSIMPIKGKKECNGTYKLDLCATEGVYFLYGALGSISTTDIGSTGGEVYSHSLTLSNTLPAFTMEQGKGNISDSTNNLQNYEVVRSFGVMIDQITLSAQDNIINLEAQVKAHGLFDRSLMIANAGAGSSVAISLESVEGLTTSDTVNIYDTTPQNETDAVASISTTNKTITIGTLGNSYTVANKGKVELVPQSPTYGTANILDFGNANFQFGADLTACASASETNIENRDFTYMNNLEERYGSMRYSPSVIAPKGAKATVKFTKYFENVADRDTFLAMEKKACIITIQNNEKIGANDTNNYKYMIKIEISDIRFTSYEMPTGTDELYGVSFEGECMYDTSDARAIRITVRNGSAGTIYTA